MKTTYIHSVRPVPGALFMIGATDGSKSIANAASVFNSIDPAFENLSNERKSTRIEHTGVFEQTSSAELRSLFEEIANPSDCVLTQHQIVSLCETYREWLCRGDWLSCFLFEASGELFVCEIHPYDDNLDALLHRFEFTALYFDKNVRRRFVVPQFLDLCLDI